MGEAVFQNRSTPGSTTTLCQPKSWACFLKALSPCIRQKTNPWASSPSRGTCRPTAGSSLSRSTPRRAGATAGPVTAEDVQFYYDVIMDPKNMTSVFRVDLKRFSGRRFSMIERFWLQRRWTTGRTSGRSAVSTASRTRLKDVDFNKQNFDLPHQVVAALSRQ